MKTTAKKIARDESGKILIMVLVLLVVGGLVLAPLLGLMSTGLMAGQVYEKKASELYAADAGVEDAMWKIKHQPDSAEVPGAAGQEVDPYKLDDKMNVKEVEVAVAMVSGSIGNAYYWVTSQASDIYGSDTRIEAYIRTYPFFWGNAITSTGDVELKKNTVVYGDVMGNVTEKSKGEIRDGDPYAPYDPDAWPSYNDFGGAYWSDLGNEPAPLPHVTQGCTDYLRVEDHSSFGPGFHDDNLHIVNSGNSVITATLTGTVYIKGDGVTLDITGGNKHFYLDLNGQTIYVEGKNNLAKNEWALEMGNRVQIKGSGVIIAEGNIKFQPNMVAGGEDDFVFVMSMLGEVWFQPGGTFHGSVAGREVRLWPDQDPEDPERTVVYTEPPDDLMFPFDKVESRVKILTWEIK